MPYIRWADYSLLRSGSAGPSLRRLYDHEFVLVMRGKGHIVLEGQAHEALPGRLFFVTPRVWHSYCADCGEDLNLMGIHFDWAPQHDSLHFPLYFAPIEDEAADESLFREARCVPGWNMVRHTFLELQTRRACALFLRS